MPAIPLKNQKPGLDKSLEEKEVFVLPLEQLKETKVRQYVFHNDKRLAEAKEEVFVPPPEQLKETKVRQYVFHTDKRKAELKVKGHDIKKRLKLSAFRRQATMRIHM